MRRVLAFTDEIDEKEEKANRQIESDDELPMKLSKLISSRRQVDSEPPPSARPQPKKRPTIKKDSIVEQQIRISINRISTETDGFDALEDALFESQRLEEELPTKIKDCFVNCFILNSTVVLVNRK